MTQYRNAPLIELIAELRWDVPNAMGLPPGLTLPPGISPTQIPFFGFDQGRVDSFFMRFAGEAHKTGVSLGNVERVVPSGFPTTAGQVVHRFKSEPNSPELYQIGGGVFTANAVPPYHSWTKFKPFLDTGIDLLLASRLDEERDSPVSISLQYIDAFGPSLTQGLSAERFIQEKLGLKVSIPEEIEQLVTPGKSRGLSLQFNATLKDGLMLLMAVSEGVANNLPAVIVHTNIRTVDNTAADKANILHVLNTAQDFQHKIFDGLTSSIKELME